jgi:UDP-glucuronate decarboxylase
VTDLIRWLSGRESEGLDQHPLMERPGLAGEVVNIGSTDEITIQELGETVIEVTDPDVGISYEPLPEDDPQRRRPDISRAKGLLDWEPAVGLRQGLEKIETKFERK